MLVYVLLVASVRAQVLLRTSPDLGSLTPDAIHTIKIGSGGFVVPNQESPKHIVRLNLGGEKPKPEASPLNIVLQNNVADVKPKPDKIVGVVEVGSEFKAKVEKSAVSESDMRLHAYALAKHVAQSMAAADPRYPKAYIQDGRVGLQLCPYEGKYELLQKMIQKGEDPKCKQVGKLADLDNDFVITAKIRTREGGDECTKLADATRSVLVVSYGLSHLGSDAKSPTNVGVSCDPLVSLGEISKKISSLYSFAGLMPRVDRSKAKPTEAPKAGVKGKEPEAQAED